MKVPYERIVQWAAGPISILAGYGATLLEAHVGVFSALGVQQASIAKAIIATGTFAVGAAVTYAAHHKWLDNLAKFWTVLPAPAVLALASGKPALIEGTATETPDEIVAGIDAAEEAAKVIQNRPGTPADQIIHGLAPDLPGTDSPAGAGG